MPTKTAHEVAANAAQEFEVLECVECAINIQQALLAEGHRGQWVEIRGARRRAFIVCFSFDSGHVGVRVGDRVFDNLHAQGMLYDEWLKDFDAVGGVEVMKSIDF